jgi:FkbM family methyltransferase
VISYAQNGEDVVLARLFSGPAGFYVDLGAGHPVVDSVTKHFHDLGWRGMNIEPLPEEHALLSQERPDDINVRAAVTDRTGRMTLFPGPAANRGASTLVAALAPSGAGQEEPPAPIEVDTVRLADLLAEHDVTAIDFLKIDIEGFEAVVVPDIDWAQIRPRVVVIEATLPNTTSPSHDDWEPCLLAAGYRCVLFDGLNRFYARADDREAADVLAAPANVFDDYQPWRWLSLLDAAEAHTSAAVAEVAELRAAAERSAEYAATLEDARRSQEQWTEAVRQELAELAAAAQVLIRDADPHADLSVG